MEWFFWHGVLHQLGWQVVLTIGGEGLGELEEEMVYETLGKRCVKM